MLTILLVGLGVELVVLLCTLGLAMMLIRAGRRYRELEQEATWLMLHVNMQDGCIKWPEGYKHLPRLLKKAAPDFSDIDPELFD